MGLINAIETIIGTIKLKRGLKENLPALKYGEAAYTYDENEMYIGGKDGDNVVNKKLTRNSEVAANTEAINNLAESVASNTAHLNAIANKFESKDINLLNGWTLVAGQAKIYKNGNICFFNMTIKGGTGTQAEIIFYTPEDYKALQTGAIYATYRTGVISSALPSLAVRTDGNVRFSSGSQPTYNGTDNLEIIGFYFI